MKFAELLKKCRKKNRNALNEFVSRYYGLIYAIVRKRLGRNDLEDVIQELLIKLIENDVFNKFKGSEELEFKRYLGRVVINHTYDYMRNTRHQRELEELTEESDFTTASEDIFTKLLNAHLKEELEAQIEALPLNYRTCLNLRLLNYSNSEIAAMLKKPVGTIDTWISRGLKKMKETAPNLKVFLE